MTSVPAPGGQHAFPIAFIYHVVNAFGQEGDDHDREQRQDAELQA